MDKSITELQQEVNLAKPKPWEPWKVSTEHRLTPPCFEYMTDEEKEQWKQLDQKCQINDD